MLVGCLVGIRLIDCRVVLFGYGIGELCQLVFDPFAETRLCDTRDLCFLFGRES